MHRTVFIFPFRDKIAVVSVVINKITGKKDQRIGINRTETEKNILVVLIFSSVLS